MVKLFSLEEDKGSTEKANDLLIDKILKSNEKKDDLVSITANIIKQRHELKEKIQKSLNTEPDTNPKDKREEKSTNEDQDNTSAQKEESDDPISIDDSIDDNSSDIKDKEDDSKEKTAPKENSTDESSSTKDEKNSSKEQEPNEEKENTSDKQKQSNNTVDSDKSTSIQDKHLEESISSKNKDLKNLEEDLGKIEGKKKDNKDNKTAQESYLPTKKKNIALSNIFKPIKDIRVRYLAALEEFNIPNKKLETNYKVAYVKESVVEALNNFIVVASNYIAKNKAFIDNNITPIKNINERLTVLRELIKERKYHFTHSLVNDQKILTEVSVVNSSSPRDTSKILLNYIQKSEQFVNYVLNNEFNLIKSALGNADFTVEEDDFVYKEMLPGFNMIRVHLDTYENYLKTNIENFHYYQLKTFKAEYLYDLEAISITKDSEIDSIMEKLDKMLIDLSVTIDNFNVVNSSLNKLIDEVKILVYDIEQNKYSRLAELDIDSKIKDFIRFKLVSEAYYCNTNMLINYMCNLIEVINKCVELKL